MPAPRLMVVTAHPDDEVLSFGGLIYLSARAGARVTLVCATRGEVGEIADPALATPETLGEVREAELRASCAELGVADLRLLDFRDSGMAGSLHHEHPRAFCRAPSDEVVSVLVRLIRELRPSVVVTWGQGGGYGHPDHMAASRHTTAAFDRAGQSGYPEMGEPFAPQALYYDARPSRLREEARAELSARGLAAPPSSRPAGPPGDELPPTLEIDVGAALETKQTARGAHRTQASPLWHGARLSPYLQRRFIGTEYFHRARPPLAPGDRDDLLTSLLGLKFMPS
jgi:LmbE family N-acetylglucosaminyl deacetylase